MTILVNQETPVLVQGITGKSGSAAAEDMLTYGTNVVAGVTPRKGGQHVAGVPVFNTIREAREMDPRIRTSVVYVPPLFVLGAVTEAIEAGVSLIVIVTENVPVQDTARMVALARMNSVKIIGPSSIGVLVPGSVKLGSIGGPIDMNMFTPGPVGVLSKSGGMCAETSALLSRCGIGQSTVIGIGGDKLIGSTFVELMDLFEKDRSTEVVVLFGEFGGTYEEDVARAVSCGRIKKPVVAFISGIFAERMERNLALGHAGAILEGDHTSASYKKRILAQAGVAVAEYHHEIQDLVRQALKRRKVS